MFSYLLFISLLLLIYFLCERYIIIKLDSLKKIKKFTDIMALCKSKCRLVSKKYIIDAKSLSGIFSLDLTNRLQLKISDDLDFNSDDLDFNKV